MTSLRHILRQLEPYLIGAYPSLGDHVCSQQVELLGGQDTLCRSRLYLGDAGSVQVLDAAQAEPGTVVLLAGGGGDPTPKARPEGCVLVCFTCSLTLLFNTVSRALAQTEAWRRAYLELTDHGRGLHAIVALTAQLADSAVLLLDQSGRVVASGGMEHSAYLAGQAAATGAIPQRTTDALFPAGSAARYGAWPVPGTDLVLHARRMVLQDRPVGMLLLEGRKSRPDLDYPSLCECATDCLGRRLLSTDLSRLGSSSRAFQQCWEDIVQRKLTGVAEIREALSRMPHPIQQFARVAVLTFSGGGAGIPYNYLIARLREIFPHTNMAVYHQDIVLLLTYPERTFQRDLPADGALAELLNRFHGYLAVSNGTRALNALASLYMLTKQTAMLAQELDLQKGERICFYEDYSMYCVIDLCAQRYLEIEGNDDILYLIHPAVIHLTRYDRAHNSNLRDVLYYYLLNDRNLVKTSACTYMHRNTVINKVNKILELLDLDLENGNLRQRLMFSCQVIRYYEKVMKQTLKL